MPDVKESLENEILRSPKIDTHEHILDRGSVLRRTPDIVQLVANSYVILDLISAGLPESALASPDRAVAWSEIVKYWPRVALSEFARTVPMFLSGLYGVDPSRWLEESYESLSQLVAEAYEREDWIPHVLKSKCRIAVSILDNYWAVESPVYDERCCVPALRVDPFVLGRGYRTPYPENQNTHTVVEQISQAWDHPIDSFDSYLGLIDAAVARYVDELSCPALKLCVAYERTLRFDRVGHDEARAIFAAPDPSDEEKKRLQDFFLHYLLGICASRELPMQIHTGFLARTKGMLSNSNPEYLNAIFVDYPNVQFSVFHLGYPWSDPLIAMAKMFSNVHLDFCWTPAISRDVCATYLLRALEMVPWNKLMWGCDVERVEDAYPATLMMADSLAGALASKVRDGTIDQTAAAAIVRAIMHENAERFYRRIDFESFRERMLEYDQVDR